MNSFGTQHNWPDGTDCTQRTMFGGRTYIRDICEGMPNANIVGIVIAKQGMHLFADKKNPGRERGHFLFTLRDSPTDFINANCWGSENFIDNLSKLFKINDIVEVKNPQVQHKQNNEAEARWRPWTPSAYQLHLSESHSSVSHYNGLALSELDSLTHMPIKASNDYYTLSDIITNGQGLHGEHINIQAVVKRIGEPKDIVTRTGKHVRRCEVQLFDETCMSFSLVLWDDEHIELAQMWTPKDIILFIADVKVSFDEYRQCMVASCDQKTIITANPDTREAQHLYRYAQSCGFLEDDTSNGGSLDDNLESITEVYTVRQLKDKISESSGVQFQAHSGILYAYVTSFDIDADNNKVAMFRCGVCGQRISQGPDGVCNNPECSACTNPGANPPPVKGQFEVTVNLSDHTGTINSFRLTDKCAEAMIGCTVTDFMNWTLLQCTEAKVKYLLEKCKVYFKIRHRKTTEPKKRPIVLSIA